jgi:mRNA-degrading endonuclease RelE of RelBE toxin-antitoxin system
MPIEYSETAEFQKDLKKLGKRFRSLPEDLEILKRAAIELFHEHQIDNRAVFPVQQFQKESVGIYKVKKFACKTLKGKGVQSGLRLIYAFFPNQNKFEFIELYYKQDQAEMDFHKAKMYFKSLEI